MNKQSVYRFSALLMLFAMVILNSHAQTIPEIERAIQRQEYQKAIDMANVLLANDPKNDKLWHLKGIASFENGSNADAKTSFQKGINYNGRDPWNVIGLGGCFAKENNFEEAKKNFEKAQELNRTNGSDILIAIADGYLNSEKREFWGEAEKILYKVKSLDPKNVNAFISLGDMYLKQGVEELALSHYSEAIKLDPKFMKGYLRAGQLQVKAKKYNEGADLFQKAMEIDPGFAPVYKELGELWYKAGKYEKASENYKKYVEMTQNDVNARQRYASFLFLTKDYDVAIREMEEVLKSNPTSIIPFRILGYCYVEKKQPEKALENFTKYFSLMKAEDLLLEDFDYAAKAHQQLGQKEKAIEFYRKALSIKPDKIEYLQAIAEMQYESKSYADAAATYSELIKVGVPKFKDLFQRANCYYYSNDTINADTAFGLVIEKYPATHVGYLFRARVKSWSDPKSEAGASKPYYEKVWEMLLAKETITPKEQKDLQEAAQYLGFYHYSHGADCAQAAPYWKKVLEFDPTNKGAQDVLKFCKM